MNDYNLDYEELVKRQFGESVLLDENSMPIIPEELKKIISKKPQMTGGARPAGSIYVAQDVDIMLNEAENIALLKDAATGSEKAIEELRNKLNDSIVADIVINYNSDDHNYPV